MANVSTRQTDVILNTKVTIARNLEGYKFPVKLDTNGKQEVIAIVEDALNKSDIKFNRVEIKIDKTNDELYSRGITSRHLYYGDPNVALFISASKDLSVLVNDGEHIKISCVSDGIDTASCFEKANNLAAFIENNLGIAYVESLGFLTSNIERIGLALNISYLAIIPGLVDKNGIVALSNTFEENYCKLTPIEPKNKDNPLYVLETKATLGIDEATLVKMADNLVQQFAVRERRARSEFVKGGEEMVEKYINEYCCQFGMLKYGTLFSRSRMIDASSIFYIVQSAHPMEGELNLTWEQLSSMVRECIMSILGFGSDEMDVIECQRTIAKRVKRIIGVDLKE